MSRPLKWIGMIGALAMMLVMVLLLRLFRAKD